MPLLQCIPLNEILFLSILATTTQTYQDNNNNIPPPIPPVVERIFSFSQKDGFGNGAVLRQQHPPEKERYNHSLMPIFLPTKENDAFFALPLWESLSILFSSNIDIPKGDNPKIITSTQLLNSETRDTPSTPRIHLDPSSFKGRRDEVIRVFDANTVKLEKGGLVTFAAVRTPSPSGSGGGTFRFPDCFDRSPSSKVRQLLPSKSRVRVQYADEGGSNNGRDRGPRPALIVTEGRGESNILGTFVNEELVRTGYARVVSTNRWDAIAAERIIPGLLSSLDKLENEARDRGVGIHVQCDLQGNGESISTSLDDQFEPLEMTAKDKNTPPRNPGDCKGCSDFNTYEDALRWYERYFPYYGDVARLDRDGDGIPCPGLPHTKDQNKYRMKIPSSAKTNVPDR